MKKWQLVSQVWTHISDRSIGGAPWRSWHLCPFYSTPVTHPTMRCLCLLAHGVPKSEKICIIYKKLQHTKRLKSLAKISRFFYYFCFKKGNGKLQICNIFTIEKIFFRVLIIIGNQGRLRNLNGHQNQQHQIFGL